MLPYYTQGQCIFDFFLRFWIRAFRLRCRSDPMENLDPYFTKTGSAILFFFQHSIGFLHGNIQRDNKSAVVVVQLLHRGIWQRYQPWYPYKIPDIQHDLCLKLGLIFLKIYTVHVLFFLSAWFVDKVVFIKGCTPLVCVTHLSRFFMPF